jgi:anti-anti-sigma factor
MNSSMQEIQFAGVLDGVSGKDLLSQVGEALAHEAPLVVIDCQQITFMDSSGFSALVCCLKKIREAGRRLALRSITPQMRMVLEITGTDKVFECI